MAAADGDVVMLENTRFHKEETKNDPEFGEKFAKPFDMFVNDAFGTGETFTAVDAKLLLFSYTARFTHRSPSAHRAHASTEGVTKHLKPSVAGFLLAKELEYLDGAVNNPSPTARPMAAIVGGSKVSSKVRRHEERSSARSWEF